MTETRFFRDGPDYVNQIIMPVCDSSIKPEYLLQTFVSACLNAAQWWLDKAADTPIVDENGIVNDLIEELANAERYMAFVTSLLYYLPLDPDAPNARTSVIRELADCMIAADELYAMMEEAKEAIEKEKL